MKPSHILLLAPALLLAACNNLQPASPAPEEIQWNRYLCDSSEQLRAHYPDENHAQVELRGRIRQRRPLRGPWSGMVDQGQRRRLRRYLAAAPA